MINISYFIASNELSFYVVILLATFLRIWRIGFDLPHIYHPDEPKLQRISLLIFRGDMNPHFFEYPSLMFYINTIVLVLYYFLGRLVGIFRSRRDLQLPNQIAVGSAYTKSPSTILLGRLVTVFFSIGIVILTYFAGYKIFRDPRIGILAALMVSISPTMVSLGRFIAPDTFLVFFALAAYIASQQVYYSETALYYIITGILIGLSSGSKYYGVFSATPLIVSAMIDQGNMGLITPNLLISAFISLFTFIATTPFCILDYRSFLKDLFYQAHHYSSGHPGMEGNSLIWYLRYLLKAEGIVGPLAILTIYLGIINTDKQIMVLASYPIIHFIFVSLYRVRNDRTIMPILPFLFLIVSVFMIRLLDKVAHVSDPAIRQGFLIVWGFLVILWLLPSLMKVIGGNGKYARLDSRTNAVSWIYDHLPPHSKIVIEAYSPYINEPFDVLGVWKITDLSPDWYKENRVNYLIFSEGMYGRFYKAPNRYGKEIALYEKYFALFETVQIFRDGGLTVRIHQCVPFNSRDQS